MKDVFILFGFVLAVLLIVGKLNEREKTFPQFFTILLLLNFAFYHLISYLLYCPHPYEIPYLREWFYLLEAGGFVLFLFKGPTHYGYCLSVATAGRPFFKRYLLHFVPGIVYALLYLPFAGMRSAEALASGYDGLFFPEHRIVHIATIILCVIVYDVYLIMCVVRLYPLLRKYPNRNLVFKVMLFSYAAGIVTTSFWPIDIINNVEFTDDVRFGSALYLIIIYLISRRYPERMVQMEVESRRNNYLKTQLQGENIESIIASLERLMSEEKLYRTQINLANLAKQLNIRQHQLSELLNAYMKTTFANYINDHRVDEAKRLLQASPDMQIIEISLEVGFNSLSVFYREFKKRVGVSPAEFRKKLVA